MNYFNKNFFKMALGFILIIALGLVSLYLLNRYQSDQVQIIFNPTDY